MVDWFNETLHDGIRQSLTIDRVLHREKTEHQDLIIFENRRFGRVLALDGIVQTTEGDEFVYHEMLAHPALVALAAAGRDAPRVLIVGGGDGGCLREVLRHPGARATMVEIDRSVIDMCREYLPGHSAGAFDDSRAKIVIADGSKFVADTEKQFDLVIVDSTDPIGPGAVLFSKKFYAACKQCLAPGGVLVTQNGVPSLQGDELASSVRHFRGLFADATCFLCVVPTYFGGFMALGWASDDGDLRQTPVERIADVWSGLGIEARYFNPAVFAGAFALPSFVQKLID